MLTIADALQHARRNHGPRVAVIDSQVWLDYTALTERCPRVIVLDQMMPGGRGLDFAANLRDRCPHTRILLFSAYLDSSIVAEAEAIDVVCMSKEELARLPCAVRDIAA